MHRGGGKTFWALTELLAHAIRGVHCIYAGPSAAHVERIAHPVLRQIMSDAPHWMPKIRYSKGTTIFPSGGTLVLAGADVGLADSSRGLPFGLCVFDEEGFVDTPDYFINSVLRPRLTIDKGRIIHISTPPRTPAHQYAKRLAAAMKDGSGFILTLDDNPYLTAEEKEEIEKDLGGRETTIFRREMLCESITEEKDAVVPRMDAETPIFGEREEVAFVGVCVQPGDISAAVAVTEDGVVVAHIEHDGGLEEFGKILQRWLKATGYAALMLGRHAPKIQEYLSQHLGLSVVEPVGTLHTDVDALVALAKAGVFRVTKDTADVWRHVSSAIWNKNRTDFDASGHHFPVVKALSAVGTKILVGAQEASEDEFLRWTEMELLQQTFSSIGLKAYG